jgi:excisionase family DNA binding protein
MEGRYLTVAEVAAELHMTVDGVYKLVARGKLPAVRRSERGMRIPQADLTAYQRQLTERTRTVSIELTTTPQAVASFEAAAGVSPAEWQRRWKADEVDDTVDNMILTIRALVLLAAKADGHRAGSPVT